MSRTYKFKRVQVINAGISETWKFFSDPANLARITPDDMKFQTISTFHGEEVYAGQLIEYYVRPLLGIRLYWMTEITHVKHESFFVDEQRFGPYELWHHQHHFKALGDKTEMTDIVHYRLPMWIFGDLANAVFVKQKLDKIFEYRRKVIEEIF